MRYPEAGLRALAGYLPNHRVPEVFAHHRVTVHVPRRPLSDHRSGDRPKDASGTLE